MKQKGALQTRFREKEFFFESWSFLHDAPQLWYLDGVKATIVGMQEDQSRKSAKIFFCKYGWTNRMNTCTTDYHWSQLEIEWNFWNVLIKLWSFRKCFSVVNRFWDCEVEEFWKSCHYYFQQFQNCKRFQWSMFAMVFSIFVIYREPSQTWPT